MSELIDKQKAINATWQEPSYTDPWNVLTEMRDRINALPTIPAPRWHRVEEPPKEEGMYIVAVFFSGHWIFDAAWFTHDITEIYCVPCEKKISGFYRGNHEVHPDYWMPIEPPKEEA